MTPVAAARAVRHDARMRAVVAFTLPVLLVGAGCPQLGPPGDVQIAIAGGDGDAWTFAMPIDVVAGADCQDVGLAVNGDPFQGDVAPLVAGENTVTATCFGARGERIESAPRRFFVRLVDRPTAIVVATVDGGEVFLDASGSLPTEGTGSPVASYEWDDGSTAPTRIVPGPLADGEHTIRVAVTAENGARDEAAVSFVVVGTLPRVPDVDVEHPAWLDDAVVYGATPYALGGTIDDVALHLDRIAATGATVVWLSPITAAPGDDFGYAVTDHFGVNERLGTKGDLDDLVAQAHARGLKVMMDFVPNHTSAAHPWFVDAEAKGGDSRYVDFYERDEDDEPTHYFDWEHLPNLDYDHPEVRRMMREAFAYWVRAHDLDGFRVDVAWGVKERAPDFWLELRRELKRIDPGVVLLAEAGARDGALFDQGFDFAYDWTDDLGVWAWTDAFASPDATADLLEDALTNSDQGFAEDALVFRFLDNNDTGERLHDEVGLAAARAARVVQLTVPGVPLIYVGDEVCASFEPYDEEALSFDDDPDGCGAFIRSLVDLRAATPALRGRDLEVLDPSPASVLAFARPDGDGALVVVNFAAAAVAATVPRPGFVGAATTLRDALAGEDVAIAPTGDVVVQLGAHQARVLVRP